jgi:anti-sigma factor RsiW
MRFCENEIVKLDYLNDGLDKKTHHEFERHLATCEPCRQEVDRLRQVASAVGSIPRPMPTRELVKQTRTRLAETAAQWSRSRLRRTALETQRIKLIPSVLTPALIAVTLILLLVVFHDYVTIGLEKTLELSVPELLWGTDADSPGASLSIPIATMLLIVALLAIPSLFENVRALREQSSAHTFGRNG